MKEGTCNCSLSILKRKFLNWMSENSRRINTLDEVEKRLSNLNILAEDVDVKIPNLRKEENLVQKAGEYVNELKFLVSEIDKKKESLG
ncbi:MAG TPA: hypothetical protein QGI40_03695 [Nitrospinaceae bacterium]|nr:hypothetical protein [Nitrospinaceae bacterium]